MDSEQRKPDIRPWDGQFEIENVTVVAETPELRVIELTLNPDETVPWHTHPENQDVFYCIQGIIDVHEKMPETVTRLIVGETCTVPARRAHLVHNPSDEVSRFLNIQGPGAYDYLPIGDQSEPDFSPKPMD